MIWTQYGPNALLFRFSDKVGDAALYRCRAIMADLEERPPIGLVEFVPGFNTILLEFNPALVPDVAAIAAEMVVRLKIGMKHRVPPVPTKEIPIVYDGQDLERVANVNRISVSEVCRRHAAVLYKVYLLGFSPGFPYLGDLDRRLHTPRLPSPRIRIAAGSVGIGGEHTGIYTVDSPGGWNIIGRTPDKIFDPNRSTGESNRLSMFLLKPGDRVRFVPS